MKKIFYFLLLSFFMFSCGKSDEIVNKLTKQDFLIETKSINDFTGSLLLEKVGKLGSTQDIKITSQVSGRVSKIYVKEGQEVKLNDTIAKLDDSILNYGLSLDKARNFLDKSKINYESTKVSLDKQIFDYQIAVDKLNLKIENFKKTNSEDLIKAENDLSNGNLSESNSKSSSEIEKLNNSIKKQELDLNNKKISDNETIIGFNKSLLKDYNSLNTFIDDILEYSDTILAVSDKNKDKNKNIQTFLGAKDLGQKNLTINNYNNLYNYKANKLNNLNFDNLSNEAIKENTLIIIEGYEKSGVLLSSLEQTLNNSITSVGTLSDNDILTYKSSINIYQSTYLGGYNSIVSLKNSINNFLNTYTLSYDSINKQIELLKQEKDIFIKTLEISQFNNQVGYNKILLNSDDTLKNLEVDLKLALNNLENAKNNREITLKNLNNSIIDAEISFNQAYENIEKLTIKSPINGTISKIFIDDGQEVFSGKELFGVLNNKKNEVIISFSKDELEYVKNGDYANLVYNNTTYTGTIYSISNMADNNLKYISIVSFPEGDKLLGDLVNITIPLNKGKKILPINIIKIDNKGKGTINVLNNGKLDKKTINIGKIYGNNVEIMDTIDPKLEIITSNLDNFDNSKFVLKKLK